MNIIIGLSTQLIKTEYKNGGLTIKVSKAMKGGCELVHYYKTQANIRECFRLNKGFFK